MVEADAPGMKTDAKTTTRPAIPEYVYVLASLAVFFGLWFLVRDGWGWLTPLNGMDDNEIIREWITRVLYAVPKIGVIVGLVSLYKYSTYALRIYFVCWVFAIGHTVMFYGAYEPVQLTGIELYRMLVHHIIPHVFFIFMLTTLSRLNKTNTQAVNT